MMHTSAKGKGSEQESQNISPINLAACLPNEL